MLFVCSFNISYGETNIVSITINQNSFNQECQFTDSCFSPTISKISIGDTIEWINEDEALHNIASFDQKNDVDYFSSPNLQNGESFKFQFNIDNSIYSYFCNIHPWMIGYVIVGDIEFEKPEKNSIGKNPQIFDNFKYEKFVTGLEVPTTIDFIGDTLFILQKNNGKVITYVDGVQTTVLDLEVANYGEQGLLGITTVNNNVYLLFTESFHDGGLALGNKIYKFYWDGENLNQKEFIHEFPAVENSYIGGVLTSNKMGEVFATSGEAFKSGVLQNQLPSESFRHSTTGKRFDEKLNSLDTIMQTLSCLNVSYKHQTSNPYGWNPEQVSIDNKIEMNPLHIIGNIGECFERFFYNEFSFGEWKDTSVILKVEPPGDYAAIGIRNSFGITVDPITGYIWDTENGPDKFDEINLIDKKFNSGWNNIQGPSSKKIIPPEGYSDYEYADPKFSWEKPIGITGLDFAESIMFEKYDNWLFVADSNNGNIYKFELNNERTDFIFTNSHLQDQVFDITDNDESMNEILFGTNFGLISDIKFGPDGALYVVSLLDGIIYRIIPN